MRPREVWNGRIGARDCRLIIDRDGRPCVEVLDEDALGKPRWASVAPTWNAQSYDAQVLALALAEVAPALIVAKAAVAFVRRFDTVVDQTPEERALYHAVEELEDARKEPGGRS